MVEKNNESIIVFPEDDMRIIINRSEANVCEYLLKDAKLLTDFLEKVNGNVKTPEFALGLAKILIASPLAENVNNESCIYTSSRLLKYAYGDEIDANIERHVASCSWCGSRVVYYQLTNFRAREINNTVNSVKEKITQYVALLETRHNVLNKDHEELKRK